ncbi:MAG: radical SAM protein [Candidatus Omnitrophota bacterium]
MLKMKKNDYVRKLNAYNASLFKNKGPILSRLDIELTERCNNNCVHCCINLPAEDMKAKKEEMSSAEIKGILKEAASLGCLTVRLTGGEPLLREDFEEIYLFARKLGLKVLIFTNACLITPHLAELFSRIPPLEEIEISLYGMKKSSYEAVSRSPGSFESAFRGVNLLFEKKVPFGVKGVLLPPNRREIDEFEMRSNAIPWMKELSPYTIFLDLHCRRDGNKNELIKKLRVAPEEGLKIMVQAYKDYTKGMKKLCSKVMKPAGNKLFPCGAGKGSGCIDAYGNFQPCLLLKHPDTSYNLSKGSLKEALTVFFPKVRKMKAANPRYLSRCAHCFLRTLCEQCPAKSWAEWGTLDTPVEYFCKIAHAQAKYLGLLQEDEQGWEVAD